MSGDEEKRRCAGQRLRDFHIEVVAEPCIWHSRLNCTSYGYIQAFMLYRVHIYLPASFFNNILYLFIAILNMQGSITTTWGSNRCMLPILNLCQSPTAPKQHYWA